MARKEKRASATSPEQTRPPSLLEKWADFVKLSHTVFALPFALAATVLAARAVVALRWIRARSFVSRAILRQSSQA